MMTSTATLTAALIGVLTATGCAQETSPSGAASSAPTTTAAATTAPAVTATATASAPPVNHADCPAGSSGEGSLTKPCMAKGKDRMMEVTWTGKMTDGGPSFRVHNKAKLDILYGNVVVYFYDKAGKQLEAKDSAGKPRQNQACAGKIFDGVMKANEKAVITFSCVKKDHVPEGATVIEAEMQTVGYADNGGPAVSFYWKNPELTPDVRPKGGVK
ncbi:MAG: hypothetical protein WKG00_17535 [Polyangiaceae bacterium]